MGVLFLLLASTATVVQVDQTPLRAGCEESDAVVATLPAGSPVQVRFGLGGCIAVTAAVAGEQRNGFMPAGAVAGLEELERARREAREVRAPASSPVPSAALRNVTISLGADHPLAKAGKLLESQQPSEALATLEQSLRQNSRDPVLLAMAGYAAWRSDEVKRAAGYLQDSLALRPDPSVEALLTRIQKEAAADRSTEKLYGARFLLRFDPSVTEREQARGMLSLLEHEYTNIAMELGCRREERLVAVVQTSADYRRTVDAAEWSRGQFDGRIHVALFENGQVGAETHKALKHEVIHACLASLGQWPAWLHEGLAQYYTGMRLTPQVREKLQTALQSNMMPRLERMSQAWSRMSTEHAALAYGMALYAVELFFENYKEYGARNLLRSPEQLPQITAQLDQLMRR
jgi:hypothetical protein